MHADMETLNVPGTTYLLVYSYIYSSYSSYITKFVYAELHVDSDVCRQGLLLRQEGLREFEYGSE